MRDDSYSEEASDFDSIEEAFGHVERMEGRRCVSNGRMLQLHVKAERGCAAISGEQVVGLLSIVMIMIAQ